MASPERIQKVADRVAELVSSGRNVVLVVSAMGDTTDELITLMQRVSFDCNPREMDQLMATGEIVSSSLMATALQRRGIPSRSFHAYNLGIMTDGAHSHAEIREFRHLSLIAEVLARNGVAVVTGFQGVSPTGDFTTLGRGGSDITAVALARDLGQKVCEKLTDEDGIYSADPRFVPNARKVWHLSYAEMETLAKYGNGILHPRAIAFARESNIRLHVRSSFSRDEGSIVGPQGDPDLAVKSIACDRRQAIVAIKGVSTPGNFRFPGPNEFSLLEFQQTPDEIRVGFHLAESFQAMPFLWNEASRLGAADVIFQAKKAVFSLVGCGLSQYSPQLSHLQKLLQGWPHSPDLFEHKGNRISLAVDEEHFSAAMGFLHNSLLSLL